MLAVLLSACDQDPDKQACQDATTAYIMARSLLTQRFGEKVVYWPPRTEVRIKTLENCAQEINGYFSQRVEGEELERKDYRVIMGYRGSNYWVIEALEFP